MSGSLFAQDTTIALGNQAFTLSEVVVRNNFDYKEVLATIKQDTTFYKAFRNLRIIGFSSYNSIQMLGKDGAVKASLTSKTRQNHIGNCRTMDILEEQTTGDFYSGNGKYNYLTPELYAGLLTSNKSGMEKHKDQLKMLFFNPGKKIPGIPFIGDKLDLYDEAAHELYDYRLDIVDYKGTLSYLFSIKPKETLGYFKSDRVVVDQMNTWFDLKTLEVLGRNYALSYKAGVYDFDVAMEVEMTKFNGLTVPKTLRYKGNWDVVFKKRERAIFTATLFDYN
jgi:hypothetical protein